MSKNTKLGSLSARKTALMTMFVIVVTSRDSKERRSLSYSVYRLTGGEAGHVSVYRGLV